MELNKDAFNLEGVFVFSESAGGARLNKVPAVITEQQRLVQHGYPEHLLFQVFSVYRQSSEIPFLNLSTLGNKVVHYCIISFLCQCAQLVIAYYCVCNDQFLHFIVRQIFY